jgi:hypothetical protein
VRSAKEPAVTVVTTDHFAKKFGPPWIIGSFIFSGRNRFSPSTELASVNELYVVFNRHLAGNNVQ